MNSTFVHRSLTRTAWQTRPVAYAVGASANRVVLADRGRGLKRQEMAGLFGIRPQGARLLGCNARRPEDPGVWQEQELS